MSLPPDLIELLCALTAAGVRFLVVGDAAPEDIGARACDALLRFGAPEVPHG